VYIAISIGYYLLNRREAKLINKKLKEREQDINMKLGIGIDTGGTYTDAVIYDFTNKTIMGSAKALTTKNDLSIGILGAIDGLPVEMARQAEIISLSTTLATNACVEDRGGRAKLIFFGGDAKVIDENGGKYGLPPSGEIYTQESFTLFSGEMEREPDWELFESQLDSGFEHLDGAGIVEMNAIRNGGFVEKKAKAIFEKRHNIPVVCGHELFNVLNSLQRGSSTLLNARLFPVIKEFMAAVKKALFARGISAPIVIVRSDGSLMSEEFAKLRPVETLLCGPAASAIGGMHLSAGSVKPPSKEGDYIIVDMGGTTTDIALVTNGVPVTVVDGVSIGKWKTFVDGLYVKTVGLGGDSAIHYNNRLYLEEYRVIPLCTAAAKYPVVLENLRELEVRRHGHFLYEHYMLIRDITDNPRYTTEEKNLCAALKDGPLTITQAAKAMGRDTYTLDTKRLIKDGIVQICGLTPTDIMHIKGDFNRYCREASVLAVNFASFNLGISEKEFCDLVYEEVVRKLYVTISTALLTNKYPYYMKNGINSDVERFILDSYEAAKNPNGMLSAVISTKYPLIGVGAPIRVFIEDVAKRLCTTAVIPQHYEVANALGAVMGSVSVSRTVEILPVNSTEGITGYTVFGDENVVFVELAEAVGFAKTEAEKAAREEARMRGAAGELAVTVGVDDDTAVAKDESLVYLGTRVTARVVGAVGF